MSLISAGDLMKEFGFLEGKIRWIRCPFCDDEVNKLRPCLYWVDKMPIRTNVCVECAEQVKGLRYLDERFPIPGVMVEFELIKAFRPLDQKYISESSYQAKISYGGIVFYVRSSGSHLDVWKKGDAFEDRNKYDNTFQLWASIKEKLENPIEDENEKPRYKKGI